MTNVTELRQAEQASAPDTAVELPVLAPASGAPRPLTVRPVRPVDPESYFAPIIRLEPRTRAPLRRDEGSENPRCPDQSIPTASAASSSEDIDELRQVTGTARSVAQAAMEVIGGSRPVQQLARWLDPDCYDKLVRRAALVQARQERRRPSRSQEPRLHRSAVVRSSRVCRVADDAYEASLVIVEAARVRAVALRLEFRRGLWKVAALEIG
ncbi:Rv3235 family protein [Crystallibacter crystallopoietes]|uniref:Rv3235 family protein n=1 Tax=Crystallibacter crystallopoietes TaxID=37928 RepID=UPI001ED9BE45|nr:Rv3235 family protein [Arthrobacter crystallopoietes]